MNADFDAVAHGQEPTVRSTRSRGRTGRWVLTRAMAGVLVLLGISVLVFVATVALPGDAARAILGKDATPDQLASLREQLGLDRPFLTQYLSWLSGLVQGDLGRSISQGVSLGLFGGDGLGTPVTGLIGTPIANSLALLTYTGLIAIPLAFVLGAVSAIKRDRALDKTLFLGSIGLTALPEFVVALGLVMLLGTTVFQLFPAVSLIPAEDTAWTHPGELVLPVLTLVVAVVPYLFRLVRASVIDALESEYVQMARLKGMPEWIVLWRHALRNALVPAMQASAGVLAYLLGGVVVVEFVFNFPGLGTQLVKAVGSRDVPVIQAIVVVFAAAVVFFNLAADVATVYVTPRLRTGGK